MSWAYIKKGAALAFLTKFDQSLESFEKGLELWMFTEEEAKVIFADMEWIRTWQQSMILKIEGDKWYEEGIY